MPAWLWPLKGLVKDPQFGQLMGSARLRLFVLSPMFTNGGDEIRSASVNGSVPSSLRLINLLRRAPAAYLKVTPQR